MWTLLKWNLPNQSIHNPKRKHTPNKLVPSTFPWLKPPKTVCLSARHPKQHSAPDLRGTQNSLARQTCQVPETTVSEVKPTKLTSRLTEAGEMVAMMEVLVRPPRLSCSRRVSLLSLQHNTTQHNTIQCSWFPLRVFASRVEQTMPQRLCTMICLYLWWWWWWWVDA